ncbi:MAG: hypothetical protein AAGC47_02260 [Bacteroidota bacterium]
MNRVALFCLLFAILLTAPFVTIPDWNGGLWIYVIAVWLVMLLFLGLVAKRANTDK